MLEHVFLYGFTDSTDIFSVHVQNPPDITDKKRFSAPLCGFKCRVKCRVEPDITDIICSQTG